MGGSFGGRNRFSWGGMEGGKEGDSSSSSSSSSSSPVGDGVVDRKEEEAMATTATYSKSSSSSSSGYFTSVFSPSSMAEGSDTTHSDLYWTKNSMKAGGQTENGVNVIKDGEPRDNPSKNQTPQNKDGKPIYPTEPIESPYFGSSVHYGGRDFFACSASSNTSVTAKTRKNNEDDGSDNSNFATRGDWWQGNCWQLHAGGALVKLLCYPVIQPAGIAASSFMFEIST